MIKLQASKKHLDNIAKYKKMFEKWKVWSYVFKEEDNLCFLALYKHPLKGISGYLFLDEYGAVWPYEKAVQYGTPMIEFNTILTETMNKMLPRMHLDTTPFQEKLDLIVKEKQNIINIDPSMKIVLNEVIDATEKALNMNSEIKEIYYAIGHLQRKVTRERGYLDQKLLDNVNDKLYDQHEIFYSYGLRERKMNGHYKKIIHFLKNNKHQISRGNYNKLLRNLQAAISSNESVLEESMKHFETDVNGNKVFIDPNNIKGSLLKKDEIRREREFELEIASYIRNPK